MIIDDQDQEELSPEELYFERQKEIAEEMNHRLPRVGDRVLVDKDWTPEMNRKPMPLLRARIIGVDYEKFMVRLVNGIGNLIPVYPQAVVLD